jgi:hypothetical protein
MKKNSLFPGILLLAILSVSFIKTDDWVLFEAHGCQIYFPKMPADQSQTINSAIGELKVNIYMYEVPGGARDDNKLYGLIETAYPDDKINSDMKDKLTDIFRGSVDGAVNNAKGKLLTESIIQLNGFPGREVRISVDDGSGIIKMRSYLVKNRMYVLETVAETKNDANKASDRFMNSFTLKR